MGHLLVSCRSCFLFSIAITFVDFLDHPHRDGLSPVFCPNIPSPNWRIFKYGTV